MSANIGLAIACLAMSIGDVPATRSSAPALTPHPAIGDRFANVFSRTISIRAPGLDPLVSRNSGSGLYKVLVIKDEKLTLQGDFLYDGQPESHSLNTLSDRGATVCWDARCGPATDASGLAYNPLLWGPAPPSLHVGQGWRATIPIPWELGPAGDETVRVVAVDESNGEATLERSGEAEGLFDQDHLKLTMKRGGDAVSFAVTPGRARWSGWARFRRGIVVSDALLVERSVTLTPSAGPAVMGLEREYITLNAIDPAIMSGR